MSYTVTIKEEICSIKNSNSEIVAELAGFIRNSGGFTKNKIKMSTENKFILERIQTFLKDMYNADSKIEVIENLNFSKKSLYQITLKDNSNTILKSLGILDDDNKFINPTPEYIIGGNSEIRAYIRGVFLSTGSINDPKKSRYHLELLLKDAKETVLVQKLLNLFDLNAKILNRDKGYMIYINEAEKISDFIKIIGAPKAVLYFEDVRVYRDQKNKTNRLNNMEQANMDKVIETASNQLSDIEVIEKNDGVMLLDDKVKTALEYRKKYPEASLKELAEIISLETNKKITKSGLNHRLRKIKDLADNFKKMSEE